jgi:O-antigen ligase
MTSSFGLPRKLIILAIILPLAGFAGYLLASPTDVDSLAFVGLLVMVLAIPLVLRWHHPMLIFSWNASIIIIFLPGSPYLWMVLGGVSFGLSLLNRILDKELKLLHVPSVTWTLICFALVVAITAKLTGGWGIRSLGGEVYGGKKYFHIWFAIMAYFALSFRRTPVLKAEFHAGLFLLSGLTMILSNLIYIAGPGAWFLYAFFPVEAALNQAHEDFVGSPLAAKFSRLSGLSFAGMTAGPFLIMKYGLRGILDWTRPWRLVLLVLLLGLSLLGGFRSAIVLYAILLAVQFCAEGLLRSRLLPMLLVAGVLGFVTLIPLVQKLPLSIQRSLSILPLPVSAVARIDAEQSTEWRLQMWRVVTPEIPKYFWLGKGFTASATDYYLAQESVKRGLSRDYETMILSGDYHNGPLSLLIPFGIWGLVAFLAFVVAALRLLYRNYRHGDPSLRRVNTLLFSFFVAKLIFFLGVFGAIHLDMATFVGIVGLSVSLNGGMCQVKPVQTPSSDGSGSDRGRADASPRGRAS